MGWIAIDRKLLDSAIWNTGEAFTKGQAWVDLLLLANYEETEQFIGYEVIKIPRGTYMTTIRDLSKRWDWSTSKVLNFLHFLEKQKMLTLKANTKKTLISIVNYENYQSEKNTKKTQSERKANASQTQKENLLYKETNKQINKGTIAKQKYGEFQNVLLTDEEYGKLQQTIPNADNLIERLSAYIESTGKKYKSHYATLLNWDRRDRGGKQKTEQSITDVLREEYAKSMREGSE
jgi:hypothetical protein